MRRWIILAGVGLLSAVLPLFSQIGRNFEYEYALLASWAVLLLIPLVFFVLPNDDHNKCGNLCSAGTARDVVWIILIGPIVALIPGAFAFASGSCLCSPSGYLFWMLLLWYPAWITALGIYHLMVRGVLLGKSRRLLGWALGAVYLINILDIIGTLWFYPQKRLVHQFAGFLHGPIYDTFIPIDHGIVLARISHFFGGALLLCGAWWRRSLLPTIMTLVTFSSWLIFAILAADHGSIGYGKEHLAKRLSERRSHFGFTLYYAPDVRMKAAGAAADESISRLEREVQFHLQDLSSILNEGSLPHVDIFVYPSQNEKKLWFGGGTTDVTDVYGPSLHITQSGWNHPTLRHELVHALTSDIGFFGLGFHPNMAFTEGLAVALAPEEEPLSLDDGAAAILASGHVEDIGDLFSPFFWQESGDRAYTLAGSFLRFLIDRYGIKGVKAKYGGASWESAFARSQQSLTAEWRDQILKQFNRSTLGMYSEALFRSPGLFRATCPHSRVDLRRSVEGDVYSRMRQPPGWDYRQDYQHWLETVEPKNVGYQLSRWRQEIASLAKTHGMAGGPALVPWMETLKGVRTRPPKVIEDVELAILLSDIYLFQGQKSDSLGVLAELQQFADRVFVGDALTREIYSRIKIDHLPENEAQQWRGYLAGWWPMPKRQDQPESWIETYLRLRRTDTQVFDINELRSLMEVELAPDLPRTFKIEWYRFLAYRFLDLKGFDLANKAWTNAATLATGERRELLAMYARQAQFYSGPARLPKP